MKKNSNNHPTVGKFNYTSVCCNEKATKPPVVRSKEDKAEGKFSECGLGCWRCTKCGDRCKVRRSRKQEGNDGPAR